MPFIDRADLEQYTLGAERLDALLRIVGDDPVLQQVALDGALKVGEAFILEYLPRSAIESAEAVQVLGPIASAEAVYHLQSYAAMGPSEIDKDKYYRRVAKMADMRNNRKAWPGDPNHQRSVKIGTVESGRSITFARGRDGYL